MSSNWYSPAPEGVRLFIRLTPRAASERIDGPAEEADGRVSLKVGVTAIPEDGKANAALIKVLAKSLKLPKTAFALIAGATDRRKTLSVTGETSEILTRIEEWTKRLK